MTWLIATTLLLCISQVIPGQEQGGVKTGGTLAPDRYDQWGDLRFVDETVHLNKIANQLKEWRLSIAYIVIHAGQKACDGEAKARGIRARNYLLKLGIGPERVVWLDGGWKKELSVDVWIWPPELGRPKVDESLKRDQVMIEKKCKIKYRGGSN
jgi:hypothetical protein